jgi:zinc protease
VIVGDFDQQQLDAWVDKYVVPIAKPNRPLPRVQTKEPARTAAVRLTEHGKNDLPAVGLTYLIPRQADADSDALRIADALLSSGESSRLYHALVYDQQLAAEVNSSADLREDLSLFVLTAVLSEGKKAEDAEKSLLAEIKKLQDTPVSAAELEKAKNQLITDQLRQRETSNGKALALGEAAVLLGDAARVNTDLSRLQAVTAADVQRVMKKYFSDANRLVLYYLPEASKSGSAAKPGAQKEEN